MINRENNKWGRFTNILIVILLLSIVFIAPDLWLNYFTVWIIFGLLAFSLDFIWGFGGIFSFGQVAFFGIGGYVYGVVGINLSVITGETASAMIAAIGAGALLAAVLGYFLFYGRISDMYLSIITIAFPLVLLTLSSSTSGYHIGNVDLGGYNGLIGIPPIMFGTPLSIKTMYVFVLLSSCVLYFGIRVLLKKPFGRIFVAIKENETRTELLGYDVRLVKTIGFTIAGGIAGFAGAVYAAWVMFMSPNVFGLAQAAKSIIWLLVGGAGTLIGGFVGSFFIGALTTLIATTSATQTTMILGIILIIFVLFVPNGLVPVFNSLFNRISAIKNMRERSKKFSRKKPSAIEKEDSLTLGTQTINKTPESKLSISNLSKSFGGLKAVDNVSKKFLDQSIYCLIGPNGAGKSTLFNTLVGVYRPDHGKIILSGNNVTKLPPHERIRCGMGIKLQITSIYNNLTVYENMWLAVYRRSKGLRNFDQVIYHVLDRLGLMDRVDETAGNLSHGEQQHLEMGMVFASKPELILLDEPTSGMSREETSQMVKMIHELRSQGTIIIVEHDMEFVRELKAPVIVFHQGKVFMEGNIDEVRNNEQVLEVYLGGRYRAANQ